MLLTSQSDSSEELSQDASEKATAGSSNDAVDDDDVDDDVDLEVQRLFSVYDLVRDEDTEDQRSVVVLVAVFLLIYYFTMKNMLPKAHHSFTGLWFLKCVFFLIPHITSLLVTSMYIAVFMVRLVYFLVHCTMYVCLRNWM